LRPHLVNMLAAAAARKPCDNACLLQHFPEAKQIAFGLKMAEHFGFDLTRGRLDRSPHPFCTSFASGDVRITTRVKANDLAEALYSTLHESGHAIYEQGVAAELDRTPLAGGTSAGVHESQSRLWENIVGRGESFLSYAYPLLQKQFPDQLKRIPVKAFYRAINRVEPSLIRTDADELTYNLHIMIRFDLECALLEGTLAVADLAEAWNARYAQDLGVSSPTHSDGCLQDVHWFGGTIGGGFQSYTIGNILSAQFYSAATAKHSSIPDELAAGKCSTLHGWLRDNVYRHGRKFTPSDLVARATGAKMSTAPYLAYLNAKYSACAA
jgi:carboxypeptidase Taq